MVRKEPIQYGTLTQCPQIFVFREMSLSSGLSTTRRPTTPENMKNGLKEFFYNIYNHLQQGHLQLNLHFQKLFDFIFLPLLSRIEKIIINYYYHYYEFLIFPLRIRFPKKNRVAKPYIFCKTWLRLFWYHLNYRVCYLKKK